MKIVGSKSELKIPSEKTIGFVPTMGAFHDGHLELMRSSVRSCDFTVVSLFVNPTQFGPGEDFVNYPRNIAEDATMAESVGVDVLFTPSTDEMYPQEQMTVVQVPEIGMRWEGEHRPGHFDGVATIVTKLFNIVRPTIAFFGRKDFQQCAVIRRLVRDLDFSLKISIEPTAREQDGLAMSSRNRYLSQAERKAAPSIFRTLTTCCRRLKDGTAVDETLRSGVQVLMAGGFSVDYLAYVDDETLEPLDKLKRHSTIICAARLGKTRLIDNLPLDI